VDSFKYRAHLQPVLFNSVFNGLTAQENIVKAGTIIGNLGIPYERSISEHFR
jgi:hypothetical protein